MALRRATTGLFRPSLVLLAEKKAPAAGGAGATKAEKKGRKTVPTCLLV